MSHLLGVLRVGEGGAPALARARGRGKVAGCW